MLRPSILRADRGASGGDVVAKLGLQVYDDFNDEGVTGWGVMTNEPTFDWQVENVRHFKWKQNLGREATTMPGTWYPDDRFLRVHLVKDGMPTPKTYPEAVMQAVHTLNTGANACHPCHPPSSGERMRMGAGDQRRAAAGGGGLISRYLALGGGACHSP